MRGVGGVVGSFSRYSARRRLQWTLISNRKRRRVSFNEPTSARANERTMIVSLLLHRPHLYACHGFFLRLYVRENHHEVSGGEEFLCFGRFKASYDSVFLLGKFNDEGEYSVEELDLPLNHRCFCEGDYGDRGPEFADAPGILASAGDNDDRCSAGGAGEGNRRMCPCIAVIVNGHVLV